MRGCAILRFFWFISLQLFSVWHVRAVCGPSSLSPFLSGAIAGFSIRSIFIVNSVIYLLMIGFVHRNVRH